eukprot:gene4470-6321_t
MTGDENHIEFDELKVKLENDFRATNWFKYIDVIVPLCVFIALFLVLCYKEYLNVSVCMRKFSISNDIVTMEIICLFSLLSSGATILIRIFDVAVLGKQHGQTSILKFYFSSLIVHIVCGVSVSYHWMMTKHQDFICVDSLGVPYFIIHLAEWMALVPFLVYMAFMIDNPQLKSNDVTAIILSGLMIFFGSCMAMVQSRWLGYLFYTFTIVSFCFNFVYLVFSEENPDTHEQLINVDVQTSVTILRRSSRRWRGIVLAVVLCVFPGIHFLGWQGYISTEQVLHSFLFSSTFVKIILCEVFTGSHILLSSNINKAVALAVLSIVRSQDDRQKSEINLLNEFRILLGNVTHDLKTPLARFNGTVNLIEEDLEKIYKIILEIDTVRSIPDIDDDVMYQKLKSIEEYLESIQEYIYDVRATVKDESMLEDKNKFTNDNDVQSNSQATDISFDELNIRSILLSMVPNESVTGQETPLESAKTVSKKEINFSSVISQQHNSHTDKDIKYNPNETSKTSDNNQVSVKNDLIHKSVLPMKCTGGWKILLVDDSEMIIKVVSKKLINAGHMIEVAENGAVALNKYMKIMDDIKEDNITCDAYDVILIDFQMPVMDGIETVSRIREYEKSNQNNNIKHQLIIGCSGNIESDRSDTQYSEMDYLLEKPFDLMKFNAAMEMLLKRKDVVIDNIS